MISVGLPFGFLISLLLQSVFDQYTFWIWGIFVYCVLAVFFLSMMQVADQKPNINGRFYDIS